MTWEEVDTEINVEPFSPLRFHLVSGKTLEIRSPGVAWMMTQSVMVFTRPDDPRHSTMYNLVAIRNIEMIERLMTNGDPQ